MLIVSIFTSTVFLLPRGSNTVLGIAYLDGPLVGSTVTVHDLNGNKLGEYVGATFDTGAFIIDVPWGIFQSKDYTDFKVSVSGGTLDNEPFTGTLVRYIYGFTEEGAYSINAITTLVAAHHDEHPSVSFESSEAAVSEFLAIPPQTTIQAVVENANIAFVYFDHYAFMGEASSEGGFDAFIDYLVVEMKQGTSTHSFVGYSNENSVAGEFLGWFGGNLANGAASYIGGQAMGWAMNLLGFKSSDAEIMDKLNQISNQLIQMDQKLDAISRDIGSLRSQIAELEAALSATETNLKNRISQIATYDPISKIESAFAQLGIYAQCKPGEVSLNTINEWASSVLDPTTGAFASMNSLDNFIQGHVLGTEEGLLELMTSSAINSLDSSPGNHYGRNYRNKVLNIANGMTDYFKKLLYVEMKGLTIISEAHHARNETVPVSHYINSVWQPRLEKQVDLFVTQMERFVIMAERQYFLEFPNMGPIPADKYQIMQNYWQQVYHVDVTNVAEILPQVDQFADQVLNGDGQFVARVLFINKLSGGVTPTDLRPTFQNMETGQSYSVAGTLHNFVMDPTYNYYYYYYRYVMDLPEGNYKLTAPTTVFKGSPPNGWRISFDESTEYWSFNDAIKMSTDSYLGQSGFINVSNVTNNPYGYWGGQWVALGLP